MIRLLEDHKKSGLYHHALDETLWGHAKTSLLRFYTFRPACVSLSYKQHREDANIDGCKTMGLDVVRRNSRGHADFLDDNTLCYTLLLTKDVPQNFHRHVCGIVKEALQKIGIITTINGESDILVGNAMIGGSVMMQRLPYRAIVQGKIRYALDIDRIGSAINYQRESLGRHKKKLQEHMTSVSDEISDISFEQFYNAVKKAFTSRFTTMRGSITAEEEKELRLLVKKHSDPLWIAGTGDEPYRGFCDLVRERKSLIDGKIL